MEIVQIYLEKLNELEVITNFLSFFFLFEKFSLLDQDPDLGVKMNADPDPQPCPPDYLSDTHIQKHVL